MKRLILMGFYNYTDKSRSFSQVGGCCEWHIDRNKTRTVVMGKWPSARSRSVNASFRDYVLLVRLSKMKPDSVSLLPTAIRTARPTWFL